MKSFPIQFLINADTKYPENYSKKQWIDFYLFTKKHGFSNLLYKKLLMNMPENFPDTELLKMKASYEASFIQHARISFEVEKISNKFKKQNIPFCFLKGYPLSLKYYRFIAERDFEDIDVYIPKEYHYLLGKIFSEENYSILQEQSFIEKKPSYIKLVGHHVYMFEVHDYLYTSYLNKKYSEMLNIKGDNGMPDDSMLFISVLLHHKYFECRLRDYIDLEFIYKKNMMNLLKIIDFVKNDKLFKHFVISLELSEKMLGLSWGNEVKNRKLNSVFNKVTFFFIINLKKFSLNYFPFKRNVFTKLLDMILTILVYDDFQTGIKCFINKYIRYVKMTNYLKIFHQMIKKT